VTSCRTVRSNWQAPVKTRLLHLGEAEIDAAVADVGPARGDDLAARVELDTFAAMDVSVAEQRLLPPAK